jgi:hypothetical protein
MNFIKIKNILWFFYINIYVFLFGFLYIKSAYPSQDFFYMATIFLSVIFLQTLFFYFTTKLYYLIFFSCGNFVYFNLILNEEGYIINIIYSLLFFIIVLALISLNKKKYLNTFFFILILINFLSQIDIKNINNFEKGKNIYKPVNSNFKKNIFIIGIDGMISSTMYLKYFNNTSIAYREFSNLNFSNFDIQSAGESTLETYGKLVTYKNTIGYSRNYKNYFISPKSKFYNETKEYGYKKQFIYCNNYFGGDPNNIFDIYFSKKSNLLGFLNYTDERWGWYIVKLLKFIFNSNTLKTEIKSQEYLILNNIKSLNLKDEKWISISHFLLPGHTINSYKVTDKYSLNSFKKYYEKSQTELSYFIREVTRLILEKDKRAIIIFMGDHGSYMLRGGAIGQSIENIGNIDKALLSRDKTEILISVYPNNLLNNDDLKILKTNPEFLFKIILEKATSKTFF